MKKQSTLSGGSVMKQSTRSTLSGSGANKSNQSTPAGLGVKQSIPSALSHSGARYIVRLFFQLLIQFAIVFLSAGSFHIGRQTGLYLLILLVSYPVSLLVILARNPEVLNERMKNMKVNTKSWDKLLLTLYVVFTFVVMNVFIGLDVRYDWVHIHPGFLLPGVVLYAFSVVAGTRSLIDNKYFEASSRIQADRGQEVVSWGTYSVVRHPGYAAIVVWAVAIPLLTGAVCTVIPSAAIVVIIAVRTYLEDNMLKAELEGYQEYAERVKQRLIPGVW